MPTTPTEQGTSKCIATPPLPPVPPRNEAGEEIREDQLRGEPMVRPNLIAGDMQPILTGEEILAHPDGLVIARCRVHTDGTVSDCRMTCTIPVIERTIIANLTARRYSPALFRGRPIEISYTFTFRFHAM